MPADPGRYRRSRFRRRCSRGGRGRLFTGTRLLISRRRLHRPQPPRSAGQGITRVHRTGTPPRSGLRTGVARALPSGCMRRSCASWRPPPLVVALPWWALSPPRRTRPSATLASAAMVGSFSVPVFARACPGFVRGARACSRVGSVAAVPGRPRVRIRGGRCRQAEGHQARSADGALETHEFHTYHRRDASASGDRQLRRIFANRVFPALAIGAPNAALHRGSYRIGSRTARSRAASKWLQRNRGARI